MTTTIVEPTRQVLDRHLSRAAQLRQAITHLEGRLETAPQGDDLADDARALLAGMRLNARALDTFILRTRVELYRERVAADTDNLDDVDVVLWLIKDAGRTWTASEIGRFVGMETVTARNVLEDLEHAGEIRGDARGARTRWSAR